MEIRRENNGLFLIEKKKIIGWLKYTLAADEAQIDDLYIIEENRNQGLGQKLLKIFLSELDKKYSQVILEVRVSNLSAIAIYKKNGFKLLSIRKNYYSAPREDALVMKLELL